MIWMCCLFKEASPSLTHVGYVLRPNPAALLELVYRFQLRPPISQPLTDTFINKETEQGSNNELVFRKNTKTRESLETDGDVTRSEFCLMLMPPE